MVGRRGVPSLGSSVASPLTLRATPILSPAGRHDSEPSRRRKHADARGSHDRTARGNAMTRSSLPNLAVAGFVLLLPALRARAGEILQPAAQKSLALADERRAAARKSAREMPDR